MKSVLKLLLLLVMLFLELGAFAQQQVMFTQYMFNQLALNPAYAGIHDGISANFLTRHQWVGFEGAPKTQTFAIHSPLRYKPVSLGAVVIGDQLGITEQFGAYFSYAYRISMANNTKLSFGLQASFNQYKADFTRMDGNDPSLAGQNINDLSPNAGAGIMWHADKFYLGFSVPQLFDNTVGDDMTTSSGSQSTSSDPDAKLKRHYFLTAGYVFTLNSVLKMKPNLLFKWVQGAPIQFDVNTNFLIMNLVWIGATYRLSESLDGLLMIQITPQFQLGYSYDFVMGNELGRVNNGSHEIMINYVFKIHSDKVVTPRYF